MRWDQPADNGGSPVTNYILELDDGVQGWRTVYRVSRYLMHESVESVNLVVKVYVIVLSWFVYVVSTINCTWLTMSHAVNKLFPQNIDRQTYDSFARRPASLWCKFIYVFVVSQDRGGPLSTGNGSNSVVL